MVPRRLRVVLLRQREDTGTWMPETDPQIAGQDADQDPDRAADDIREAKGK